jgi:amino acid adenylation domain-containing protein
VTRAPAPARHRTLAGPFEEQADRTPDAVCLVIDRTQLTYRELNDRANRLAHHLIRGGAGPGERVGICLDRGLDLVVSVYAVVKTGAAYVPLDPELPVARLAHMLDNASPLQVLVDPASRDRVPGGPWTVLDVTGGDAWAAASTANPAPGGAPSAALHLLYTSGTTGRPKGVVTRTDAAQVNIDWMQRCYPYGPGDCAVLKTSPGFDVSIWELFWPLQHGARLAVCPPGVHREPRGLAEFLERHGVTMIFTVPTMLAPLLDHLSPTAALRWVVSGGETLAPWLRDATHAALPATTLVNAFGPTEAGSVTDNVIPRGTTDPIVPVGRPAPNFRVAVLDERLRPEPPGVAGEAWIAGEVGLGQGYWRAPGLTAQRFVADPHGPPGTRMYRTGDLCRLHEDGRVDHLGRIDRQIKIHGLRVEPGEIESVLAADPAVADCAVLAHGDPVCLFAFVVPVPSWPAVDPDTDAIGARAAAVLPEHMRPDVIVPVAGIPATTNGKTDEEALLRAVPAEGTVVPPSDAVEAALAEMYGRLLDRSPISMLDSFVALGGHSLLAFQLLDECETVLGVKPDVIRLLTGTVGEVAESIRSARTGGRG